VNVLTLAAAGVLGSTRVAGAAPPPSIRHTLSRLMQVLPQGMPLLQFRWAAAGVANTRIESVAVKNAGKVIGLTIGHGGVSRRLWVRSAGR
jgi:hypothetical protein